MPRMLDSCLCTQDRMESPEFRYWCRRLGVDFVLHRKYWEWCFIAQALHERGLLAPGKRGLGFGVGTEPLVALFASYGCEIVATDQDPDQAHREGWPRTGEYMESLDALNQAGLCDPVLFRERVATRIVDMNDIPDDLTGFDFTWSASSLDHCGTLGKAETFLYRQMDCLRPGGYAVHTSEYNVSSEVDTVEEGPTICFRKRDLQRVESTLSAGRHHIRFDYSLGDRPEERHVDEPPYTHNPHLRLRWGPFVTTSFGLVAEHSGLRATRIVRRLVARPRRLATVA